MKYFNNNLLVPFLTLSTLLFLCPTHASPLPANLFKLNDSNNDSSIKANPLNYLDDLESTSPNDHIIDLSIYGEAIIGEPDEGETANLIAKYVPEEAKVNPEELGSYLEGDILLPTDKVNTGRAISTKNAVLTQSSRWPGGIVPFEISGNFGPNDLATIQHAMEAYHRHTCIRFVPRTHQHADYISIVNGNSGCWSSVGRVGGKQEVNLQTPGCLSKPGTPMHELMHALGFLHEQNRQERDGFVSIQYQNIQSHAISNFDKGNTQAFGVPYDYGSVMHYSANAFSRNGQPTIVAVQPSGNAQMGQRNGFSAFDVEKLNKMYACDQQGSIPAFPAPIPNQGPFPAPVPAPAPIPAGGNAGGNGIIGSFLGGLISGLGLAEEGNLNLTLATNDI